MEYKRRVQVPVKPETKLIIQAYADACGTSLAGACSQIIEETAPHIAEITKALRMAHKAPAAAMKKMSEALTREIDNANQLRLDIEPKPTKKKSKVSSKATGVKKKKAG